MRWLRPSLSLLVTALVSVIACKLAFMGIARLSVFSFSLLTRFQQLRRSSTV